MHTYIKTVKVGKHFLWHYYNEQLISINITTNSLTLFVYNGLSLLLFFVLYLHIGIIIMQAWVYMYQLGSSVSLYNRLLYFFSSCKHWINTFFNFKRIYRKQKESSKMWQISELISNERTSILSNAEQSAGHLVVQGIYQF